MARKKTKCWRFSVGERPNTVEVYENRPGGLLYVRAWDPTVKRRVKLPLKHRDREAAMEQARRESTKLAAGSVQLAPSPTIGYLLMQYLVHRTPQKTSTSSQRADKRQAALWNRVLGPNRRIATLGSAEWYQFIRDRRSGTIDANGEAVQVDKRVTVGERTVDGDLVFIVAVLNWATSWSVNGTPILDRNPWGGGAPGVKRALERPRNRSPKRPVATFDRFLAVRKASERVMMEARRKEPGADLVKVGTAKFTRGEGPVMKWMKPSYLPELLDLVEDTGRRITAVCRLWYSDLVRERVGGKPVVTMIRWRPFKKEDEQVVPIGARARAAIERILELRPGVGDTPIFPANRRSKAKTLVAIEKRTATDWLIEAERIAFEAKEIEVQHLDGGAFHPYRRKWATERKHLADKDVMLAGGWSDPDSLKASYQHSDHETMLAVINEPRKLMEKKA